MDDGKRRVRMLPVAALVVASMVGTGVFTSLGYQVRDIPSGPALMVVWALGGVLALCGALSYAELGAALPKCGGEYQFLSRLMHPSLGWMAGVLSAVIGFAAPAALAAMALGKYGNRAFGVPELVLSTGALGLVTMIHIFSVRASAVFQTVSTAVKLVLITGFVIASLVLPGAGDVRWMPAPAVDIGIILSPAFAIALLFVFYAYSGWNAAVYIVEEVEEPERNLSRALVLGTLVVVVVYLALNAAFLRAAPLGSLAGVTEVGHVAAVCLFGDAAARWFSGLLAVGLLATVSALVWAGPRVLLAMGRDIRLLGGLSRESPRGVPTRAILFQSLLSLVLILVSRFDSLLAYTQIGLTACSFLTVACVFVLRRRGGAVGGGFRCPWFPIPPLVFLVMTGFVMIRSLVAEPVPALAGLGTALLAWGLYFPLRWWRVPPNPPHP